MNQKVNVARARTRMGFCDAWVAEDVGVRGVYLETWRESCWRVKDGRRI